MRTSCLSSRLHLLITTFGRTYYRFNLTVLIHACASLLLRLLRLLLLLLLLLPLLLLLIADARLLIITHAAACQSIASRCRRPATCLSSRPAPCLSI
jgi:hypothetical protein